MNLRQKWDNLHSRMFGFWYTFGYDRSRKIYAYYLEEARSKLLDIIFEDGFKPDKDCVQLVDTNDPSII